MKINLSKEHIKKGCELVEDYYGDNEGLWCLDGFLIDDPNDPLYRDFLQLVIEGINREFRKNKEKGYAIDQMTDCIENSKDCRPHETYYFNKYTETEAKEKAIAYVFDNMEVK